MKKYCSLILLMIPSALVLISCNTTIELDDPVLAAPLQDTTMSEIASVKISERKFGRMEEELLITRLDGEKVKKHHVGQGIYRVSPGIRKVRLKYLVTSYGAGTRQAYGTLEVDFKPGRRYVPNSRREGDEVTLFMIDAITKEIVSDYVTVETSSIARNTSGRISTGNPQDRGSL